MIARRHIRVSVTSFAIGVAASIGCFPVGAEEGPRPVPWPSADQPAYPTSPYHGMVNGDGQVIPCRCRFQGHEFRVGDEVCMSTHLGVVMTRCDLMQNNTSWVPTATACTISRAPDVAAGSTQIAGR